MTLHSNIKDSGSSSSRSRGSSNSNSNIWCTVSKTFQRAALPWCQTILSPQSILDTQVHLTMPLTPNTHCQLLPKARKGSIPMSVPWIHANSISVTAEYCCTECRCFYCQCHSHLSGQFVVQHPPPVTTPPEHWTALSAEIHNSSSSSSSTHHVSPIQLSVGSVPTTHYT